MKGRLKIEKTELKERPIIMGADSVRAILDGRKTQTRRVIKPRYKQDEYGFNVVSRPATGERWVEKADEDGGGFEDGTRIVPCPFGEIGDRLWVRETVFFETFHQQSDEELERDGFNPNIGVWVYRADNHDYPTITANWTSPMFMSREASRITLEITDIRVERVQDITEEEVIAEGIISDDEYAYRAGEENLFPCPRCKGYGVHEAFGYDYGITEVDCTHCNTPKKRYRIIWDSLNAKRGYPWENNPWVWVISFKQIHNQKEE